jgi:hypothetical protein
MRGAIFAENHTNFTGETARGNGDHQELTRRREDAKQISRITLHLRGLRGFA